MRSDIQTMQRFMDLLTGTPLFSHPARTGGDRPEGEFCSISLLTEKPVGMPNKVITKQTTDETTYTTVTPTVLRFRVGIVETDGIASTQILGGWHRESVKQLMMETGFGFVSIHPIALEDAKLEEFWEARQGVSIDMYTVRKDSEVVNNITGMVINGNFHEPDGNKIALQLNINP